MYFRILAVLLVYTLVISSAYSTTRVNIACKQRGLQGRVMWFDANANIWQLSTRQGVQEAVEQCKRANINTIIVDVKPLSGFVLYNSKIAPKMKYFNGKPYPANYDLLQTTIEECRKAGIEVHAAINVFSEGSQTLKGGPAWQNPDWQCVHYDVKRYLSVPSGDTMEIVVTNSPKDDGNLYLFDSSSNDSNLPWNTTYLRVYSNGKPELLGVASGKANISAPKGGYVLVGTGNASEWLKEVKENNVKLTLSSENNFVNVSKLNNLHHAVFVNPLHPEAREYSLNIIRELVENYDVDGIVLDRMRYPNFYSDFSDITRKAFEDYLGHKVENWPEDIYRRDANPNIDIVEGPLLKEWKKFRATVIRNYLAEAREIVKNQNANKILGVYVGAWYHTYYDVGVNWGSPRNAADYDWWPEGYESTGYADLVDYITTGCYYFHPTRNHAIARGSEEWKSVEAAAEMSVNAVKEETFVYGSLFLKQYNGRPQDFMEAVKQVLDKTEGIMFFDLVYVRDYEWWDLIAQNFPQPAKSPHNDAELIEYFRSYHQAKADANKSYNSASD
ncbi:MAG: alpha amylase family protein [Armatimonadota bacterium]